MEPSTSSKRERSQWSELPQALLEILSQKITSVSDYIRFRCVCKHWRSSALSRKLPPQIPLLMLPSEIASRTRSFLSLASNRVCIVDLPEACNKAIIGSSYGWLILFDPVTSLSPILLNPVTRAQIILPSTTRLPSKAFLSSVPTTSDICIVMMIFIRIRYVAFCRLGDATWTELDTTLRVSPITAVSYHNGQLYMTDKSAATAVISARSSAKPILIPSLHLPTDFSEFYLLSSSEELFLVTKTCYGGLYRLCDGYTFCNIYKLDSSSGEPGWSRVRTLGDCSLFVSRVSVFSVRVSDYQGCIEEDCVYSAGEIKRGDKIYGDIIHILDSMFPGCYEQREGDWFTPNLC